MHFEEELYDLIKDVAANVCPSGPYDLDSDPPTVTYRRSTTSFERDIDGNIMAAQAELEITIFSEKETELWSLRDEVFSVLDNITTGRYRFELTNEYQELQLELDNLSHVMIFDGFWTGED